jgi:hypothetical protein
VVDSQNDHVVVEGEGEGNQMRKAGCVGGGQPGHAPAAKALTSLPLVQPHGLTIASACSRLGVEPGPGWSCIRGRISQNVFLGSVTQLLVELQTGETLTVHELNDDEEAARLAPGTEVTVGWALPHSYAVSESRGATPTEAAAR